MNSDSPRASDSLPLATVRYGWAKVPGLLSLPLVATYFELAAGRHTLLGKASGAVPNAIGRGPTVVTGEPSAVVDGGAITVGSLDPPATVVSTPSAVSGALRSAPSPPRRNTRPSATSAATATVAPAAIISLRERKILT